MDRRKVLSEACERCLKELYEYVYPKVTWEQFIEENKKYKEKESGPPPFEFYYLPTEIVKDIVDEYIYAFKVKSYFEDHVDLISSYFSNPIREVYTDNHKNFEHFKSLKSVIGEEAFNKVIEYLEEAKNFYDQETELSSFQMTIYLGACPSSNAEKVIENWKKYRNTDITINDEEIKEEFYGEL